MKNPKHVKNNINSSLSQKFQTTKKFVDFKNIFAYELEDPKNISRENGQHQINLIFETWLMEQRKYCINLNDAKEIQAKLDKLL